MKKKVHGRLLLRYYVLYVYHCTCGRLLWILYRYIIRGSCVLLLLLLLMATDVPVISVRDSAWPRNNFSPVRSLSLSLSLQSNALDSIPHSHDILERKIEFALGVFWATRVLFAYTNTTRTRTTE